MIEREMEASKGAKRKHAAGPAMEAAMETAIDALRMVEFVLLYDFS